MIIASPVKKDTAIPLENLHPASPVECLYLPHDNNEEKLDVVNVQKRINGKDFVTQMFGQSNPINHQVDEILVISTTFQTSACKRTLQCQAFIFGNTVFLSSPLVGDNSGLSTWADGEFQSCITHLIELAEEKTGCNALVVAVDRQKEDSVNTILRAFMYLGFQMVDPAVYRQEPGFILVGYEL
ncbi:hypothetical protein DFQ28_009008 [Apophysomyces sp. BC1034]|nr:hypothetical protein DFQ30_007563 [Apophysomyces sp. BC1015]KAG0176230.1 hypothetical protein DFQ29_006389 [Apophysomyces sp. BC1021]KAG0185666.1 hypothetical protein DFQ28_009008 [Apophysomyces sp. BC1034]